MFFPLLFLVVIVASNVVIKNPSEPTFQSPSESQDDFFHGDMYEDLIDSKPVLVYSQSKKTDLVERAIVKEAVYSKKAAPQAIRKIAEEDISWVRVLDLSADKEGVKLILPSREYLGRCFEVSSKNLDAVKTVSTIIYKMKAHRVKFNFDLKDDNKIQIKELSCQD